MQQSADLRMLGTSASLKDSEGDGMKKTKEIMLTAVMKDGIKLLAHNNVLQTCFAADGI